MRDGFLAETAASTIEIVTVDDLKDHLKISSTAEDDYLQTVRDACADYLLGVDGVLNRAEGLASYTSYLREFSDEMVVPLAPIGAVSSVVYLDTAGSSAAVSTDVYVTNAVGTPARVERKTAQTWPTSVADRWDAVQINFTAGSSDAAAAPADVKHLIKLMAGHFWQNREPVAVGTIAQKIPATFDLLIEKATVRLP